jgi:hypothetical protein
MGRIRLSRGLVAIVAGALIAAAVPAAAGAASRATVVVKTVKVGSPGNPSVAIVPFTDAIYQSCADAPSTSTDCATVGDVGYRFRIGRFEVTVKQWVKFLNRADPTGSDPHNLYDKVQGSANWPKYGQINFAGGAPDGRHYSVAYSQWADKPYGFANFLRTARFANSLFNGTVLSRESGQTDDGFPSVTYKVKLSRQTEQGMYDLSGKKRSDATRDSKSGFVIPSQDEWIKSAYYDPSGGGTYSYWKYPTNPGVFGDDTATAPSPTTLDPTSGNVTNAATQPLATYKASDVAAPTWCPKAVSSSDCTTVNPFGMDPTTYGELYQGSLGTVGQAKTAGPWGTLDQGGNAVEWTDTITPPPAGKTGPRVWRRLHGGVPNAPAYQLWLSAIGLQPQDNSAYNHTYPWLGFRVGVIGKLSVDKR